MPIEEHDFRRMLDAYLAGRATDKETRLLEEFFLDYKDEVLKDKLGPEEFVFLENRLKTNIKHRISPRKTNRSWSWAVAASVSLLIVAGFFYLFPARDTPTRVEQQAILLTRTTDKGQKLTIRLPDGSVVKLNSKSSLAFPDKFDGKDRQVTLSGEAYFDVVHNPSAPFIVKTSQGEVTVLGTTFNIRERADFGEITLVSGKVRVADNKTTSIVLKPNQQARLSETRPGIDTMSVDVQRYTEWKDNVLSFRQRTLEDAIADLEDWYGVEITLLNPELKPCQITARYENESLENVLESFTFMLKGKYTLNDKKVTISGRGCKWI
jgi:transmembrane sensor